MLNARIEKSIRDRFTKVNKLGGKSVELRRYANKVRDSIEEDKDKMVEIRQEDKTLPDFEIPYHHVSNPIALINEVEFLKNGKPTREKVEKVVNRGDRIIISGPNGIGKSTLLKSFLDGKFIKVSEDVRIGYYSQDFSELDFNQTVLESLYSVAYDIEDQDAFTAAGRFMLSKSIRK
ncbi:MAG: hypothetical protein Q9M91_07560 [Candidatus Dojkabacteria bacterium]|nr:hypothetical protein [Candidatus Dojkabacteria bacterium]